MSTFRNPAAFYLAGRAVYTLATTGTVEALSVEKPHDVLTNARRDVAGAQVAFNGSPEVRRTARSLALSTLVGAISQSRSGLDDAWEAAMAPIANQPALFAVAAEARKFVSENWGRIRRLALVLCAERQLNVSEVRWISNVDEPQPQRMAA